QSERAIGEMHKGVYERIDYSNNKEIQKQEVLSDVLIDPRPLVLFDGSYSKATLEMLSVFRMIKKAHAEFGKRAIEVYLISMTEAPSDLLEVLVLAKETGLYRLYPNGSVESDIDVAPLLETIDDLVAGPKIMQMLFDTD